MPGAHIVGGPYFDDLSVGTVFDTAPGVTLTDGLSAAHQVILGDRIRLALDTHLSRAVTGAPTAVVNPGLVCDIAIGQSTLATHHVKANLFYRGLRFHRFPHLADTLYTRTEVVGLRENSARPGRPPTGLAALRMTTTDQDGRTVLDFYRCAMLPLSDAPDPTRVVHADDLSSIGPSDAPAWSVPDNWNLNTYRDRVPGERFSPDLVGTEFANSGDVVTSAPELARLSLNIAAVHHDERVGGSRLVYGGHTIGIALAQAVRALPNLVTVLGWESCDHTGPVRESDTLTSTLEVVAADPIGDAWAVHLRSIVHARSGGGADRPALDWRFTALMI